MIRKLFLFLRDRKIKKYLEEAMPDPTERIVNRCPICGYEIHECQCLFGGSCHPDRTKQRRVVLDHLYMLTEEQLNHIKKLQQYWQISYGDDEMQEMTWNLKEAGICKPFHKAKQEAQE